MTPSRLYRCARAEHGCPDSLSTAIDRVIEKYGYDRHVGRKDLCVKTTTKTNKERRQ